MTYEIMTAPTIVTGTFARVVGHNLTQWWLPDDADLESNAIRCFGHFTPLDRGVNGTAIRYATSNIGTYVLYDTVEAAKRALTQA